MRLLISPEKPLLWGVQIQYHDDASPTIGRLLANWIDELLSLEIPDFETNPETSVVLDQIRQLVELSEGQYPIVGVATGPFSWPTLIMGNDRWLTSLFMEEPETLRAVLEKAQTFATAWANAQIKTRVSCNRIGRRFRLKMCYT